METKQSKPHDPRASRNLRRWLGAFALGALVWLGHPREARAGYFELSAGGSFSKSNYGDGSYEWTRRWNGSFGYHFSDRSEMEVTYQDSLSRTYIPGYQNTVFHDQSYSATWIQSLFGRTAVVDPYFKLGIGQLDRVATGTYDVLGGASADSETGQLTEIVGVGLRIGLTRRFGIRAEADTYVTDFKFSSWKDNVYLNVGLSFYF
jgi:hypothetical protein